MWKLIIVVFASLALVSPAWAQDNQFGVGLNGEGQQRAYGWQDREYPGGRYAPESGGDGGGAAGGGDAGAASSSSGSGDGCR